MKLTDKIWLLINRKPPSKTTSYWAMAISWCFVGGLSLIILLLVTALLNETKFYLTPTILTFILLLLTFGLGWGTYQADKKSGFIDTIHKHATANYEQKRKELTK
jgi:hypothetical protein